jgi:hypothetical protein
LAAQYASFAPADVKESGGGKLWDNVNAKITAFKFTKEMPNGYVITPQPGEEISPIGAMIDFEIEGQAPVEERRVNQFFSVGAKVGLSFDIAPNGYALVPKTEDATIYTSNFTKFVKSLVENGLSAAVANAGDFSKIVGLSGHFKRVEDKDGRDREWTDKKGVKHTEKPKILLCTKVLALPAAGGAAAPAASAAAPAGDFDLDSATTDYLTGVLKAKKKPVQRSQILLLVSQAAVADQANRAAIAKRAQEEDFLNNLNELGIVKYDAAAKGQPVSLPEAA